MPVERTTLECIDDPNLPRPAVGQNLTAFILLTKDSRDPYSGRILGPDLEPPAVLVRERLLANRTAKQYGLVAIPVKVDPIRVRGVSQDTLAVTSLKMVRSAYNRVFKKLSQEAASDNHS